MASILKAEGGDERVDAAWEALIGEHPSLTPPPQRQGINPFTKQLITIPAAPDIAVAVESGREVGMIERARDGSGSLVVWSEEPGDRPAVLRIAEDVARRLGRVCDIANQ